MYMETSQLKGHLPALETNALPLISAELYSMVHYVSCVSYKVEHGSFLQFTGMH